MPAYSVRRLTEYKLNFKGGNDVTKSNFVKWIKAAGIRAVKTVAQTAVATIGSSMVISAVDWRVVLSASILSGVLSVLTSIAGLPELKE